MGIVRVQLYCVFAVLLKSPIIAGRSLHATRALTRRSFPRALFLGAPASLISSQQSPPQPGPRTLSSGPSYPAVIPLPEAPTKAEAKTNKGPANH
jgi:hypothetical protein